MEITFIHRSNSITLPVNPSELSITNPGGNKSSEVIGEGEVSIIRTRKLQKISIDTFLPNDTNAPYAAGASSPSRYVNFFNQVIEDKAAMKMVIAGAPTDIFGDSTRRMTIESFQPSYEAGSMDVNITLSLREYRPYSVQQTALLVTTTTTEVPAATTSKRPDDSGKIVIGSNVIANGRVHYDSTGSAPGRTLSNYSGKVNLIQTGAGYPYHVTTPDGGWLGWMTSSSVRKA